MALQWSTAIRQFIAQYGSYKRALENGVMRIWSGVAPATADAVASGNLLIEISLAGGTRTPEVRAAGSVTISAGTSGTITSIVVNGVEILGATVTWTTSHTATATLVANQINKYLSMPDYEAVASGAKVTIIAMPGTGTTPNGMNVTATCTGDVVTTDVNMGSETAGVAAVNGLQYLYATLGVLVNSGLWSGVVSGAGTQTAGYFRIIGSVADDNTADTDGAKRYFRVQGTIATSGADYNMSNTSLTNGVTYAVNAITLTVPAA